MEAGRLETGYRMGICACAVALLTAVALTVAPGQAKAASPILEFALPADSFPVGFTASGGEVTAELEGFDTVVHCAASQGSGELTGPRSASSSYVFTGCETQTGTEAGLKCKSEGAAEEEIVSETVEAELVFIDQAKREVGMLLNPDGGTYMSFECGGQDVEASGPFLSPVGPTNQPSSYFTAILTSQGATQTPDEYEGANGEKLPAVPTGRRNGGAPVATGVSLSYVIHTSVPLELRAITAAEIEARQRQEAAAAAAAKKRQEDEAAAARRRQEDEAAAAERQRQKDAAAARKRRQQAQQRAKAQRRKRAQQRSKALTQCRKADSKQQRVRCENRVKNRYSGSAAKRKQGK